MEPSSGPYARDQKALDDFFTNRQPGIRLAIVKGHIEPISVSGVEGFLAKCGLSKYFAWLGVNDANLKDILAHCEQHGIRHEKLKDLIFSYNQNHKILPIKSERYANLFSKAVGQVTHAALPETTPIVFTPTQAAPTLPGEPTSEPLVDSKTIVKNFIDSIKTRAHDAEVYIKVVTDKPETLLCQYSFFDNQDFPRFLHVEEPKKSINVDSIRSIQIIPKIGHLVPSSEKENLALIGISFDQNGFIDIPSEKYNAKVSVSSNNYHVAIFTKDDEEIVAINAKITSYKTHCHIFWAPEQKNDIHALARKGNIKLMNKLLSEKLGELEKKDAEGRTPLHAAIASGKFEAVEWLFKQGANLNALDGENNNMIEFLFSHCVQYQPRDFEKPEYKKMLEFFLQKGIDPNIPPHIASPPLHLAADHGMLDMLEVLLKHGVDVNQVDTKKRTALHYAIENQQRYQSKDHQMAIQLLINHGASLEIADRGGITPFMLAEQYGMRLPQKRT